MSTTTSHQGWANGASVFAAVTMMLIGAFQLVQGLTAVVDGTSFYVNTPSYLFDYDPSTWGVIHIVLGVLMLGAGYLVLTGSGVGRAVGVGLASLTGLVNFLYLPFFPVWATIVIALSILVVWGLANTDLGNGARR